MSRTRPSALRDTVRFMLDRQKYEAALHLLERAADSVRQSRDWHSLLEIFLVPQPTGNAEFQVPSPTLLDQPNWRILIARLLSGAGEDATLEHWVQRCLEMTGKLEPELVVLRAYALICATNYAEARRSLLEVLGQLPGAWLGLAHQRLLWVAHHLQQPWQPHLTEVRQWLEGRTLGLALLDAAHCAHSENETAYAQALTLEALPLLRGDTYHLALANLNIGFNLLREVDLSAEAYFTRAYTESLKSEGKPLRARALAGLAALRRVQGEWRIALELYRRATKAALDAKAAHEAQLIAPNTARTQRLSGDHQAAIATMHTAIAANLKHPSVFWLELAAAHLRQGDALAARQALERVQRLYGADLYLQRILEAELARLAGNEAYALEQLRSLPPESRLAREEVRQFPELFRWASTQGMTVPEPLPYPRATVVRLKWLGTQLQVSINHRALPAWALTQDVQLLLHMLRFPGQRFTADDLALAVFDLETIAEKDSTVRDLMVKIINRLRHRLEYPESVRDDGTHFWLDPDTVWITEV